MAKHIMTEALLKKMIKDREEGLTYKKIQQKYGISQWTCIHYLKDVKIKENLGQELWRKAEKEAQKILLKQGFKIIVNLNEIYPQGSFDVLAEKNNEKWLIDVTVNERKDLEAKSLRIVKGYRCAILYISHDFKRFNLAELKVVLQDKEVR